MSETTTTDIQMPPNYKDFDGSFYVQHNADARRLYAALVGDNKINSTMDVEYSRESRVTCTNGFVWEHYFHLKKRKIGTLFVDIIVKHDHKYTVINMDKLFYIDIKECFFTYDSIHDSVRKASGICS